MDNFNLKKFLIENHLTFDSSVFESEYKNDSKSDIHNDIERDLNNMNETDNPIEYLKDIIEFCNRKIKEIEEKLK